MCGDITMSYLADARLAFGGRFLSDVSTNNNTASNYRDGATQQTLWNTLGGATAQAMLHCDWDGLRTKSDFLSRQTDDPILLAMGHDVQRPLATG